MIGYNLIYQSEEKGPDSDFNLDRLSPLTKYFLKVSEAAFEKNKNLILINSHRNCNISLVLAYKYATKYQKSVYINLGDDVSSNLNKDYYLMTSHIPVYYRAPIGIIDDEGNFDVRPYIPKRARRKRSELRNNIKEYVDSNKKSRIALGTAEYNDEASLVKTGFDSHDIGLIITDLESRLNREFIDRVVDWVKFRENLFIFKIDSIDVDSIEYLASRIDAVIVPLIPAIYLKDECIRTKSEYYFKKTIFPKRSELFCVDSFHTYEKSANNIVVIVHNSPKTLNRLRKKLYALYKNRIHVKNRDVQSLISSIVFISDVYIKSFLIPPLIHLPIQLSEGYPPRRKHTSKRGGELVKLLSTKMSGLSPKEYQYCRDVIDTHNSIYRILTESKRYGRNYPYSSENKTYKLLRIIEDLSEIHSNILVVTVYRRERLRVENTIKKHFPNLFENKNIKVMNQENAYRSKEYYDLVIFSDRLNKQYQSLSVRYDNSIVLGYADSDADFAKAQIEYNTEANEELVSFYNESISNITLNLGIEDISKITLLEDESKTKETSECGNSENTILRKSNNNSDHCEEVQSVDSLVNILDLVKGSVKQRISKKELDEDDEIGVGILSEVTKPETIYEDIDTAYLVNVRLTNINTNEIHNSQLDRNKEYVFYDLRSNKGDIEISTLDEKKIGMGIVFIGDGRGSVLHHLAAEVYGSDDFFDEMVINLWKDEVRNITFERGDKKYLHQKYKEIGGDRSYGAFIKWLDLSVIAPQQAMDLKLLGKVLESESIISYYELIWEEAEKMRTLFRVVGRQFNKIIASIAKKNIILDPTTEYLRQFLVNKIFRIDGID